MTFNFKKMAAGAALGAMLLGGAMVASNAQDAKHTIVTVVKLSGIAWFNRMKKASSSMRWTPGKMPRRSARPRPTLHFRCR